MAGTNAAANFEKIAKRAQEIEVEREKLQGEYVDHLRAFIEQTVIEPYKSRLLAALNPTKKRGRPPKKK
jgi:hypothetical protein